MKARALHFLVCPIDRGELELVAWEETSRPLDTEAKARAKRQKIPTESLEREITTGVLLNKRRNVLYPIHEGVPRLLPFTTGVGEAFVATHRERIARELPGFTLPSESPVPGEAEVLRTFSAEWVGYDWSGDTYWNLDPQTWFKCMRFVLGIDRAPIEGQQVLEVGIGVGGVANHNASVEGAEVVGIDLGYAVDPAYKHFGQNPFLHIVQASAFAPPFRDRQFDFVYSFGVLHHTFDTKVAFDSVSRLPKDGGKLYVWVYSPYDESRTLVRRVLMGLEQVVRPVVARLPDDAQTVALTPLVPLYVAYQWWRSRGGEGQIRYGWREAMHAARDRFTPRYIHRHTDDELRAWFKGAGYDRLVANSELPKPDYVPVAFTACAGVEGVRAS